MYDSDMAVYLGRGNPAVEKNIALMKRWDGRRQVTPQPLAAKSVASNRRPGLQKTL